MKGTLYVTATPIGNLNDISLRAIETLKNADFIAAEDTRNTLVLLNKFEIKSNLIANHKFNENNQTHFFINQLLNGKNVALVVDAGTPCISDPGHILVSAAIDNSIDVVGIPGASAAITALSISGFDSKSFVFWGFICKNINKNAILFEDIKKSGIHAVIFYESPKRILKTLNLLEESFSDTKICVCNDLSKKFERIYRGTPNKIKNLLSDNLFVEKGEYTIVVDLNPYVNLNSKFKIQKPEESSIEASIIDIMVKTECDLKNAINAATQKLGVSKKDVYAASINIKNMLRSNHE